ncbi:MAG TPA: hypothetical protein VNA89_14260 [Gemmatimonadaceae bacterium]|nr:hypothetical protein [Gemmatimonadaceae bacterium]
MADRTQHAPHVDRYIPAHTNRGWGIAALVTLLAVAFAVGAYVIPERTYYDPTHPTAGVASPANQEQERAAH